jgi:hypothetical protein
MKCKETHCDRVPETYFDLQKTEHYICTTKGVCVAVNSFVSYPKWNIKKIKVFVHARNAYGGAEV